MSGLQIRDARAGDRDAAEGVTLAAFQEYAASKSNRWENYRQNILAALAAVRPATQIVAEQNSEIIGSVLLYPRGTVITIPGGAITLRWPEVRLLAVAPAARGQGVGAALSAPVRGESSRPPYRRRQERGHATLRTHGLSPRAGT